MKTLAKVFFLSFLFVQFITTNILAQGNLLVFPKRVVFEDGKKYQSISLTNTGVDTAMYNISLVQIRMNENGSFENITDPDSNQLFASGFIRFFPHSVVLGPNESQVVKIQLIKSNEMEIGEYRSHLYFRAENAAEPLGEEKISQDTTSISVHLNVVFGITIPVIIRNGFNNTTVNLTHISFDKFNDSIPVVSMEFDRIGNMSTYGDILVNYLSPEGKKILVGEIQGFAVYTPGTIRKCKIELKNFRNIDYTTGKLIISYNSRGSGKSTTIAEQEFNL